MSSTRDLLLERLHGAIADLTDDELAGLVDSVFAEDENPVILRDRMEIQRAHDVLAQLQLDREMLTRVLPHPAQRLAVHAATDCLCWVMNHHHNNTFADNLKFVEDKFRELGIPIFKASKPFKLRPAFIRGKLQ